MKNLSVSQREARQELALRELSRRRASKHLIDFNRYVYPGYKTSWHIEVLCDALEMVISGKIRFLIVEMPPRHSKSLNVSQLFPAFIVGEDPDAPIIVSSYSGDLATDHGRETREIINSEEYQKVFRTRLAADSKAKSKWNTVVLDDSGIPKKAKGAYNAAGVGGSITGKGAKYFIVDDPFKDRKEVDSELIRDDRFKWLRSVARTRLTPDGRMVIMHTRWHDDDIIGRITSEDKDSEYAETWVDYFDFIDGKYNGEKWVRLRLSAIAEKDEKFRKEGEALWPDQYNVSELSDIKKTIGTYEFSALYQQNPVDEENKEFRREWFKYREFSDLKGIATRNFLTIDPRGKDDIQQGKDYVGLTRNYVDYDGNYNLRSERRKLSSKALIDLIFSWYSEDKFEKIGIEDTQFYQGMKSMLMEEMQKRGIYLPIKELTHSSQKELRILGLQPRYEFSGVYHITISSKNQCTDLEEELLRFPKSINDDASDSASMQLEIADSPINSVGDYITVEDMRKCVTDNVNDQSGSVVIGLSTSIPTQYVVGNKQGIFFNNSSDNNSKDCYQDIQVLMDRFSKCFIFSDQVGDVLPLSILQSKYPGKVFVCWVKTDPKSQTISKINSGDEYNQVDVAQSSTIQMIVEEIRDKRIVFNGSSEDWSPVFNQFSNLRRTWEVDNLGNKVPSWSSHGPMGYVKALMYFRVGIDIFAEQRAQVVGADVLSEFETAKIIEI